MIDTLWKMSSGTRALLVDIEKEIDLLKTELTDGTLKCSISDERLVREYMHNLGRIEALKDIKEKLIVKEEITDDRS